MTKLHIDAYRKSFGHKLVLDIPTLSLEHGIYWVKGANGAGKSTLFKSIAGMIPFSGSIQLDSVDLLKSPIAYRLQINYTEADPLYPTFLTGSELIDFYAIAKKAETNSVKELIEYFNIQSYITQPISTYSSGMLKKLTVMLAFIGQPSLIILDEPFITIEDSFLERIYELVGRYHRSKGTSFLIATHQPLENDSHFSYRSLLVADQTIRCEF